jgi:tetratricopeptide (TPR) repeat protein
MKKMFILVLPLLFIILFMSAAGAAQQDPKKAEADAYKAWYDAQAAKDYPQAYALAKEYVEKFPAGQNVDFVKRWIVSVRWSLFNEAIKSKNVAGLISLGKEALAQDPDNLDYIYLMIANIRQIEMSASPPNFSHAAEVVQLTDRAIALIESGKRPSFVTEQQWNQKAVLAYLHQGLGIIAESNKDTEKALNHYKRAAALDPSNAYYQLRCGQLNYAKYAAAVEKFHSFPEADRQNPDAKPEVKQTLDQANSYADAVIEYWARFMALTKENNPFGETRDQIEKVLTGLYQYRHPDAPPDGLQKLIDQYRSGNPPGTAGSQSN